MGNCDSPARLEDILNEVQTLERQVQRLERVREMSEKVRDRLEQDVARLEKERDMALSIVMKPADRHLMMLSCAAAVLVLAFWIVSSMFEAQTFNKLSDKDVTTWDAMWVKLRIGSD